MSEWIAVLVAFLAGWIAAWICIPRFILCGQADNGDSERTPREHEHPRFRGMVLSKGNMPDEFAEYELGGTNDERGDADE